MAKDYSTPRDMRHFADVMLREATALCVHADRMLRCAERMERAKDDKWRKAYERFYTREHSHFAIVVEYHVR